MGTVPVRLPTETAASLKRVASAKGMTPGAMMETAWRWWIDEHRAEIVGDLEAMIEAVREHPLPEAPDEPPERPDRGQSDG